MTRARDALVVTIALMSVARAEPTSADVAFRNGRDLMKAQRYAEACAEFERSEQLEPALGTLLNIAACDEKLGKLATAIAAYRTIALGDSNAERKATAERLARELEPRVPKLSLVPSSRPAGLVVTIDGKQVALDRPIEVDVGERVVKAGAPGFREVTITASANAGSTTRVELALVAALPEAAAHAEATEVPARRAAPQHHTFSTISLATGGAIVAGGLVAGWLARDQWNRAQATCPTGTCPDVMTQGRADAFADTAHARGTISTLMVVAGGALVAVGIAGRF